MAFVESLTRGNVEVGKKRKKVLVTWKCSQQSCYETQKSYMRFRFPLLLSTEKLFLTKQVKWTCKSTIMGWEII